MGHPPFFVKRHGGGGAVSIESTIYCAGFLVDFFLGGAFKVVSSTGCVPSGLKVEPEGTIQWSADLLVSAPVRTSMRLGSICCYR
jgi:hypothetical protein